MENLIQNGVEWLAEYMSDHASANVTYRRDNSYWIVPAVISSNTVEIIDEFNETTSAVSYDFLIEKSELAIEPQKGDRIIVGSGTTQAVYEVNELHGEGYIKQENCWRWSDPYQVRRRIHTKLISAGTGGA